MDLLCLRECEYDSLQNPAPTLRHAEFISASDLCYLCQARNKIGAYKLLQVARS